MVNNKKYHTLLSIVFCIAFFSCNTTIDTEDKESLSSLLDGYFYYYGEYPSSVDSFLSYYEAQDSAIFILSYIENNKKDIIWSLSNPSIVQEELTIKIKGQVLFHHFWEKHFSFLDDLIDSYERDYLEYPRSLKDLINYDKATKGTKEELFDRCIIHTLEYLEKVDNQITWTSNDTLFLMISDSDTIDYRIGPSLKNSICSSNYWREKFVYLFYDEEIVYIPNEKLGNIFKCGLKALCNKYSVEQVEISKYHILIYEPENGLKLLCKNDSIDIDTEWFHDIEGYLYSFCSEHGLGRVIFASPSY